MIDSILRRAIKNSYLRGVIWIIAASFFSSTNDLMMQLVGSEISPIQVTFIRAAISSIILLPLMFFSIGGVKSFMTSQPLLHILRSIIGFLAISFWCYGTGCGTHLSLVSTISLTVPLLTLPFAYIFLKERVTLKQALVTSVGFVGIVIALSQDNLKLFSDSSLSWEAFTLTGSISLMIGAMFFALGDIVNKYMVIKESQITMLFYFALGISVVGAIPAYMVWIWPTSTQWLLFVVLGCGSNLVLYCILKGFREASVSSLAPYRYSELAFAALFDILFFTKSPQLYTIVAAMIIIPTTFFIALHESEKLGKDV